MIKKSANKANRKFNNFSPVFVFTNNTDADIPISIFNNTDFAIINSFNAKTQYKWDITAENFTGDTSVNISAKTGSNPYKTYSANLPSANANGVVAALNSFGIGIFYTYQSGGSTYISTWNDTVQYSNLNIVGTAIYPSFILNINFLMDNATNGTEPGIITLTDVTAGNQVLFTGSGSNSGNPYNIQANENSQFSFLNSGDIINLGISFQNIGSSSLWSSFNTIVKQNGVTISSGTIAGQIVPPPSGPLPPVTFPYLLNATYDITGTIEFL